MRVRRVVTTESTPSSPGFPEWAWWAVLLATFLFLVPATSPWWSTVLRTEIPGGPEDEVPGFSSPSAGDPAAEPQVPGSMLKVVLHMRLPGQPLLGAVEREIPYTREVVPQITAVLSELGVPSADAAPLLTDGARVLDVAFTRAGTVYVDLSPEFEMSRAVGAEEEKALVQGIVTTITDNFTSVRRVVILVDGKAPAPGHLDLSRPLLRDDPAFAPDPEPEPETSAPGDRASSGPTAETSRAPGLRATPKPLRTPPLVQPIPEGSRPEAPSSRPPKDEPLR